jgi:hypothetical protein
MAEKKTLSYLLDPVVELLQRRDRGGDRPRLVEIRGDLLLQRGAVALCGLLHHAHRALVGGERLAGLLHEAARGLGQRVDLGLRRNRSFL